MAKESLKIRLKDYLELKTQAFKILKWLGIVFIILGFAFIFSQFAKWKNYTLEASYFQLKEIFKPQPQKNLMYLGEICRRLKNDQCVEHYFSKILDIDPNNTIALAQLGQAQYHLNQKEKALLTLSSYFSLGGDAFDVAYLYGKTYEDLGYFQSSLFWKMHAVKLNPSMSVAIKDIVETFLKQEKMNLALSFLGNIQQGILPENGPWRTFANRENFQKIIHEAQNQKDYELISLDGFHFYAPSSFVDMHLAPFYFKINFTSAYNFINSALVGEEDLQLDAAKSFRKIKYEDIEYDVVPVQLKEVYIGGILYKNIDVFACRKCPNVLGKSFKNMNSQIESVKEFNMEALRIQK